MAKAKNKTVFFCKECGMESPKWLGQCPGCHEWDSFVEEPVVKTAAGRSSVILERREPSKLSEVVVSDETRTMSGIAELDRVLGGGIVTGSLVLVGGDPGIGKSTLLLQMCRELVNQQHSVLYVSGEESVKQIKMRADRLGKFQQELYLLSETDLDLVVDSITKKKPEVVIIDSIQTMYREELGSAPGSVGQVRETTSTLMRLAKSLPVTIFIIGHVTKEGVVAGPRVLEHMVDTVLYFEGDRYASYRILRGVKNRFGSTNEIGVFEMADTGLRQVENPSEYMLNGRPENTSGSIVTCSVEGTRPMLVEIQALACKTNFGMPRRTAAGTDYNRVNLLIAVLEKRLGMHFGEYDVYINMAGGIRLNEPALDLGIIMALISSYKDLPIDEDIIAFGEVGLSGEVRAVNMAQRRVSEAKKLGFKVCILPKVSADGIKDIKGIKLIGISNIRQIDLSQLNLPQIKN